MEGLLSKDESSHLLVGDALVDATEDALGELSRKGRVAAALVGEEQSDVLAHLLQALCDMIGLKVRLEGEVEVFELVSRVGLRDLIDDSVGGAEGDLLGRDVERELTPFAEDLSRHNAGIRQEGEEGFLVKLACAFLLFEEQVQVGEAALLHGQGLDEVTSSDLHGHDWHEVEARA